MENFGIINVWLEHCYFLTGTSETGFSGRNFVKGKKLGEVLEKHP